MERLLHLLPKKPQPLLVRYGTTAAIMILCGAISSGVHTHTGYTGLFVLLPGIFTAGLLYDRGASLFATILGVGFALFSLKASVPLSVNGMPLALFAATGILVGLVAETLRTEMEKAARADEAKAVLLMELAHRTKNNLAMISAMMRLQANKPDVSAVEALNDMAARIQVMAQVYDHLTIRAERKVVNAKEYITEICHHLSASISGPNPVAITVQADELFIHSEQAVPIAIILNELVTNSLKYAFPEGKAGHIRVGLHADGNVTLTVQDNGVGLRQEHKKGIGSRVLALLTQQLGGTMEYENLNEGCRVTLRMPKPAV